eukprot:SAG31_NODE_398_length_16250_cov_8.737601_8_plen_97_part_00
MTVLLELIAGTVAVVSRCAAALASASSRSSSATRSLGRLVSPDKVALTVPDDAGRQHFELKQGSHKDWFQREQNGSNQEKTACLQQRMLDGSSGLM